MSSEKLLLLLIITLMSPIVLLLGFNGYSDYKHNQMQSEHKLQSYQLETERKQAEAMLIYAKALELSCAAELVNEFGEVYTRD